MSLLTKHNLSVATLASKSESRFTLQGIYVTPQETVVTDGHLLVAVGTSALKADQFPTRQGTPAATDDWKPFILDAADAKRALVALPKKSTIPVLECAAVLVEEGEMATIVSTDLERSTPLTVRRGSKQFPDYKRVIQYQASAPGEEEFSACFNAAILGDLFSWIAKANGSKRGDSGATDCVLRFNGSREAMRVDSRTAGGEAITALVSPMREDTAVTTTREVIRELERTGLPSADRKRAIERGEERLAKLRAELAQLEALLGANIRAA